MEFLNFLAQYRTPAADIFFQFVTYFAQELIVVAVICWFFWCSNKRLAYSLGFAYFTSGILVQGLKISFRVPRPWGLDSGFHPVESAVPDATGYSFPSGHTQSATALGGTFLFHMKKTAHKFLCFLFIVLIGFSRMYLGCHTPADVLVSFFVSIVCTFMCYHFFYIKDTAEKHKLAISVSIAVLCLLLCAYALYLNHAGIIEEAYAADCIKASGAGIAFAAGYYIERTYIRFSPPSSFKKKLLRLSFGLLVCLLILEGLKLLLGTSLAVSFLRYFAVVFWVLVIYPLIFTVLEKK